MIRWTCAVSMKTIRFREELGKLVEPIKAVLRW